MEKLKVKKFLIAARTAVIASTLSVSFFAIAEDVTGWINPVETVVIARPTEKVLGHAPGMETFLLARNNPNTNASGFGTRLQICDALKVNYRILDIDGDVADIEAIKKSIRWFVQVVPAGNPTPDPNDDAITRYYLVAPGSTQQENKVFSEIFQDIDSAPINSDVGASPLSPQVQNLSLILYDEIRLREGDFEIGQLITDDELSTLSAFVSTQTELGNDVHIGYEIQVFTRTGEPFDGNRRLYNNQSENTLILPPNPIAGNTEAQEITIGAMRPEFQSIVDKYTTLSSFKLNSTGGESCEVPPPVQDNPYVIGYYEITRGSSREIINSHLVDYLVAGNEYRVKFYLDKNQNGRIDILDDEDVTENLLDETNGKDYLNRPFINGLRLDMSLENFNADQSSILSVFANETTIGMGANEVKLKGIALDQFIDSRKSLSLDSIQRFFFIDNVTNPVAKYLIFRTFEGIQIPDEILAGAPQLLGHYQHPDNAVTLQRFVLNVRSKLPAGYPSDLVGQEGGTE